MLSNPVRFVISLVGMVTLTSYMCFLFYEENNYFAWHPILATLSMLFCFGEGIHLLKAGDQVPSLWGVNKANYNTYLAHNLLSGTNHSNSLGLLMTCTFESMLIKGEYIPFRNRFYFWSGGVLRHLGSQGIERIQPYHHSTCLGGGLCCWSLLLANDPRHWGLLLSSTQNGPENSTQKPTGCPSYPG